VRFILEVLLDRGGRAAATNVDPPVIAGTHANLDHVGHEPG